MNHQFHLRRGFLIAAGMIFCLTMGMYVERWRAFGAGMDSYEFAGTVQEVYAKIRDNYVEPVDAAALQKAAIDGMMGQLDPYSTYFTKEELQNFERGTTGKFSGIGAEMSQDAKNGQFIIVSPIANSPALEAGIMAGDRILKVNGEDVDGWTLEDLTNKVSGLPGSEVKLTVLHEGEKTPVELTIKRAVVTVHSVRGYKMLDDGAGSWDYLIDPEHRIAYVRISSFMDSTAGDLDKALLPLINSPQGLRGIVLDLRFNPGGLLSAGIDVANRFLDSGVIVSTKGRDGVMHVVGEATKDGTYPPIPLTILVNEYSASASEIVAGALQDHGRAILIGNRTFGKGSVQNLITLHDSESAIKLTTALYYLPSGRNITRKKGATTWGVDPDRDFLIPFTDAENKALLRSRRDADIIHPHHAATTGPATTVAASPASGTAVTSPAGGVATTQEGFTDRQLQRALEVLVAHEIFLGQKPKVEVTTTRPGVTASLPAPAPTTTTRPAATRPTSAPARRTAPAPRTAPDGLPSRMRRRPSCPICRIFRAGTWLPC